MFGVCLSHLKHINPDLGEQTEMDKHQLSERDICTKFITPAIQQSGWQQHQFREEVILTDGRVMVRGKMASRIVNPQVRGGA